MTAGTGAIDQVHCQLYPEGGGTALASFDNTASDIGDNPITKVSFGVSGTVTELYTMHIDSVQVQDNRTSFIPTLAADPPVVSLGATPRSISGSWKAA